MLRNILLFLAFFVLVGSSSASFAEDSKSSCDERQRLIRLIIDAGSLCKTDEDCAVVTMCPFGCNTPINKAALQKFEKVRIEFEQNCPQCKFKCAAMEGKVACIENRCKITK